MAYIATPEFRPTPLPALRALIAFRDSPPVSLPQPPWLASPEPTRQRGTYAPAVTSIASRNGGAE